MAIDKTDQSLPSLLSDLTRDTVELVRQEIALARTEMSGKITKLQTAATSVAIGAAILLAGLFIILQAVVNFVIQMLPPEHAQWLGPLLVGAVISIIGLMMLKGGTTKLKSESIIPQRTMDSLKRDKIVAQEKMQ